MTNLFRHDIAVSLQKKCSSISSDAKQNLQPFKELTAKSGGMYHGEAAYSPHIGGSYILATMYVKEQLFLVLVSLPQC